MTRTSAPSSRTATRRRGRPATIDRQAVLGAARRIPPADLTMSALARSLRVTPAALYHYFPNRQAVLDALAADLVDGVPVPDPDQGWRNFAGELAHGLRRRLLDSPWALELTGRAHPLDAGLRLVDPCLRVFIDAGFAPRDAMLATQMLLRFALGSAIVQAGAHRQRRALATLAATNPDAVATIVEFGPAIGPVDEDADFAAQLDVVLTGIAARHAPEEQP